MRVAVIGIAGVGMAHVCAARRLGMDIVALIDHDPVALAMAKVGWSNVWEGLREEVPTQPETLYLQSFPEQCSANLVIIATPPDTHAAVLESVVTRTRAQVLLEKPISRELAYFPREYDHVNVSAEWRHHSKLRGEMPRKLAMAFPESHRTKWKHPLSAWLDFGPHLLSVLDRWAPIEGVLLSLDTATQDEFTAHASTIRGTVELSGRRHRPYGLFVDGRMLMWENDLFDKQLRLGGWAWDPAVTAHNLLVRCV